MTRREIEWLMLPWAFTGAWFACGIELVAARL